MNDAENEALLYWELTAALRLSDLRDIRERVNAYLKQHEAPELRALYAGTLTDPDACLAEASRAVQADKTPLTLFQYGRALPPARSLEVLHEAVTLAETEGESYAVFRNGSFYARRLLYVGRLEDALYWATWTRTKLGESDITDPNCHALLANTLAYVQLLLGQPNEAADTLKRVQPFVAKASQPVQDLLGTTQADHALCRGDLEGAERLLRACHRSVPRRSKGETAKYLVRVLLEQEQTEDALDIAREAAALTAMEPEVYRAHASLALGMALSVTSPTEGTTLLGSLLTSEVLAAHRKAQAALYLAQVFVDSGDLCATREVLAQPGPRAGLRELSADGVYLLIGPRERSDSLYNLYNSPSDALMLRGFGEVSASYADVSIDLTPRLTDILVLLALHPRGLSADELLLLAVGDRGNRRSVVSSVSQLRQLVPVSPEPYKLTCVVEADFLSFRDRVLSGDLTEALRLYGGPLLPYSDAPGIAEARVELEELLKQAALLSRDADLVFEAAQHLPEDLELWEHLLDLTSNESTRASLVKARVASLRKSWGLA